MALIIRMYLLWFAQNSLPLRWQRQRIVVWKETLISCDLLKIHYLCGDKDNSLLDTPSHMKLWFAQNSLPLRWQRQLSLFSHQRKSVVICSKFITFAVTKTTVARCRYVAMPLWFAQNSLPLRWQRQLKILSHTCFCGCDLLKIHYLCGDKDNPSV